MHAAQTRTLADYNRWMNQRLYACCATLDDATRRQDRGAFFGSIHGTLNHLLVADKIWMGRFEDAPFSVPRLDQELHADFAGLRAERETMDARICDWAGALTDACLAGELSYVGILKPEPRRYAMWVAVTHFFNHQAHHRGQLTALLSQAGVDYGATDLILLPGLLPD